MNRDGLNRNITLSPSSRNSGISYSLIVLAFASCNFSRLEMIVGAESPDRGLIHHRLEPAGSGVDETSFIFIEEPEATVVTDVQETFPFLPHPEQLIHPFMPPAILPVEGVVQVSSSPHENNSGVVFVDSDANGENSTGDSFIGVLQEEGYFSGFIPYELIGKPLLALVEIPGETGSVVSTLRAPAGSTVISPLTEFIIKSELSQAELKELVLLPDEIDITQFDPSHEDSNPEIACQVLSTSTAIEALLASELGDFLSVDDYLPSVIDTCSLVAIETCCELNTDIMAEIV